MQPRPRLLFALIALCLPLTACRKTPEQAADRADKRPFSGKLPGFRGAAADPDALIRGFMKAVLEGNGKAAYAFLPDFKEYEAIYPRMPDADTNPESPRMIASMMIASNGKELPRWLKAAEGFKGFSRFELGTLEKHQAYSLVRQVRIFVRDSSGAEIEFPLFRTLIEVDGTYKIWTLLET